jgi:hypothetical protein
VDWWWVLAGLIDIIGGEIEAEGKTIFKCIHF